MKSIRVVKFGGTSVGMPEAIRKVIAIVKKRGKEPKIRAVVISAFSGVTDELIRIAQRAAADDKAYVKKALAELRERHLHMVSLVCGPKRTHAAEEVKKMFEHLESAVSGVFLLHELSPGALDYVISYGERLSAHIVTYALTAHSVRAEYLNARNIIRTDGNFGSALVDFPTTNNLIRAHFKKHPQLQVVTGFIASTKEKKTTTLGRGGSDYTASILASALGAAQIEIWTDVPGVMTADPRKVKEAFTISQMSYIEAVEMSYFGAKVIHPPTMQPALEKKIPIYIKNTFDPDAACTLIHDKTVRSDAYAKGITAMGDVAMVQIHGSGLARIENASARLFGVLSRCGINVVLITQASSQLSISLAIAASDAARAKEAIDKEFALERRSRLVNPAFVERGFSILAIVGEDMKERPGVAGRLFQTLGRNSINIVAIAQGSSELNISFVISEADETKALNAIHSAFFFPARREINLFLVGTGLIGSTLLSQMAKQNAFLARERGVFLRLLGIADRKKMLLDKDGIDPALWKSQLEKSRSGMHLGRFLDTMKKTELPNKVFVDCTGSQSVADTYEDILKSGISVVTPSKLANSSTYEHYATLKRVAAEKGARFLYETNVGAGLPIIGTLNDLLVSGDRIVKIEAILSGTLSYIFNTFTGERRFSEVVREAKEKGYTEPDPRTDLSGIDVGRKLLILAREIGLPVEYDTIHVESLLSPRTQNAKDVGAFFTELAREDARFEKMKKRAEGKRERLRYIATLEKGRAGVSLRAIPSTHPFYQLSGSDNIVAITTERYKETPLVVKGPGAGGAVTAAGVFADILRTVS